MITKPVVFTTIGFSLPLLQLDGKSITTHMIVENTKPINNHQRNGKTIGSGMCSLAQGTP